MNPPLRFFNLHDLNRWMKWLLALPAGITLVAFGQLGWEMQRLKSLCASVCGEPELEKTLRLMQMGSTLLVVVFFVCWVFFALRNVVSLENEDDRAHPQSSFWRLGGRALIGSVSTLRLMNFLWASSHDFAQVEKQKTAHQSHQKSIPPAAQGSKQEPQQEPEKRAQKNALIPIWWSVLITANVAKLYSVVLIGNARTSEDWLLALHCLQLAYLCYLPLYGLTWLLLERMAEHQYQHWQQVTQKFRRV